jgi:branched-chain amino acid transport system ATP-binding protein
MLTANRIAVSFGGVRAVDDVSLDVATGTIVGLIGPNGSGKSTFLNAVCGLVPARGRVEVDNHRVRLGDPRHSWSARIIRTFQTPQVLASLTCMENVAFTSRDRGWSGAVGALVVRPMMLRQERARWARAAAALDRVGLADYAQVPAGQLSYGRRRLLELARVINAQPLVLLLDEPTAQRHRDGGVRRPVERAAERRDFDVVGRSQGGLHRLALRTHRRARIGPGDRV